MWHWMRKVTKHQKLIFWVFYRLYGSILTCILIKNNFNWRKSLKFKNGWKLKHFLGQTYSSECPTFRSSEYDIRYQQGWKILKRRIFFYDLHQRLCSNPGQKIMKSVKNFVRTVKIYRKNDPKNMKIIENTPIS